MSAANNPFIVSSLISWRHCSRPLKHFGFNRADSSLLLTAQVSVSNMNDDYVFLSIFASHGKS